jgi:hypothetical protein
MLAFVGAGDDKRAARLARAVAGAQSLPTRYGATTRDIGLPACRALRAFGAATMRSRSRCSPACLRSRTASAAARRSATCSI